MRKLLNFLIIMLLPLLLAADNSLFVYENPGFLIITHPEADKRETTAPKMSVLGAANPEYPLYINDEEITTTANGFFTAYVDLELGDNVFVFENGDDVQSIVITRAEPDSGWGVPVRTDYFSMLLYGSTENNYISRFANLDDDLYSDST